jgi:hypothetical protein
LPGSVLFDGGVDDFFALPAATSVDGDTGLRFGRPPWAGPGESRPEVVHDLRRTLAESDAARVVLERVSRYSTGCVLDVVATVDAPADLRDEGALRDWRHRTLDTLRPTVEGQLADGLLRIGVRLGDGRAATQFDHVLPPLSEPDPPVLMDISGAGYRAKERRVSTCPRLWLWPVVTDGCELIVGWPAFGIAVTAVGLGTF